MFPDLLLLTLAFVSFVVGLVATRVCRDVALDCGLVDQPDCIRKLHSTPTPRIGGVAIAIGYGSAYLAFLLLPRPIAGYFEGHLTTVQSLFPAVLLIFITGLVDDLLTLRPWQKLGGQTLAAIWAYCTGVQVTAVGGALLPHWLSLPITIVWLVACANALNLIDGLDGLAAGVGLFASITILCSALLAGRAELALATVPLVGALLGFLRYNFNPASIYLGDSGSLLIGFLLACFAVLWSQKSATLLGITAPVIALTVPIIDTTLAIARRFLIRRPIFSADRGHIHHRLLDLGLSPRSAVLVLYGCCAVAATASLVGSSVQGAYAAAAILFFCALVACGVRRLGYAEFRIAARVLGSLSVRRQISGQVSLVNLQLALASADTHVGCFAALRDTCRTLGFDEVRLSVGGIEFCERLRDAREDGWTARIPLPHTEDFVLVKRQFTVPDGSVTIAALANALRAGFEAHRDEPETKVFPVCIPAHQRRLQASGTGLPAA